MPPAKTNQALKKENGALKKKIAELEQRMEEQKAEEDRRQEEEELKKKKKEEEKEEGLRLLHAREKAEEEETRISKALKAKKEEYKVHAEARRVEAQKDKEEKDRLWARIYQLDSREEARKDAEKVDIDEIGQMTEDKKEALKKWRAAEAELSDHSYSTKLQWDRECSVCRVTAPFSRGLLILCGHDICLPCAKEFEDINGEGALFHCPKCRQATKITKFFESVKEESSRKRPAVGEEQSTSSKVSRPENIQAPPNEDANGNDRADDGEIIFLDFRVANGPPPPIPNGPPPPAV